MEKRKKWDLPHWVTPGVFSGEFVVDQAVERITSVKQMEINLQTPQVVEQQEDESLKEPLNEPLKEQIAQLELELKEVKDQLASWEKRYTDAEEAQAKERQYLYQVVLSLKQEWENERNARRDH
jgi:hypothetical protein